MTLKIEQFIVNKSAGIKEYARQLNEHIGVSDDYGGCIKNYNEPIEKNAVGIFHFSNATRFVLLPLMRRKGLKNLVIVHDILPRTWWLRGLNRLFFRIINSCATHIIVHTQCAKKLLLEVCGFIVSSRVTVIPHGIFISDVPDSEKERVRQLYGFSPHDKILFSLGVISKPRGQLAFLETFAALGEKKLKLIVAGKCRSQRAAELMKKNDTIFYYGFATNPQVWDFYKMCDAVVVYRQYSVGESSSSIAYGLGFGRPSLVSNVDSFKEMLANSGLLFENNRGAIVKMLQQIASGEIDLEILQQKVRTIREHYTWENYFQKIMALITQ